jgi:hypothetical protein
MHIRFDRCDDGPIAAALIPFTLPPRSSSGCDTERLPKGDVENLSIDTTDS